MKLLVKDIIIETNDALSIHFKNGNIFKKFKYKPGQFLTIHVPINGEIHKRAYSFSSNPFTDRDLKITIKRVEEGLVSNYIHDSLKIGDKLEADTPMGSFFIEPKKTNKKQYVLFAGGSGITPIFSILKSILAKEKDAKILLIYANQYIESIIFYNDLLTLQSEYPNHLSIEHFISSENINKDHYHNGFITRNALDTIFESNNLKYDDHVYMICGPFGYMEKVKEILKENGINRDKISIEVFKLPEVKVSGNDLTSKVTIKHAGEEHEIDVKGDTTILQQAMFKNIVIPYSCRSGMCAACKAKCTEGKVKMLEGHFLSEDEVEQGNILTCISYPLTEKITLEI